MKPFKAALAAIILMMLTPDVPAQHSADDTQYLIIVADMQRPAFLSTGKIYISVDGQQGRIFIMMKRKNPYGIDRTPIDTIYQDSSKNPGSETIKDGVPQKR